MAEDNWEEGLFAGIGEQKPIAPKKVIVSLTDWCNLRCDTCWRMDKEENPNRYRDTELSFKEIKQIFEDCKEMGVKELDLTGGGEPFSHPRILEILRLAKDMGFWVTLTNNGTILNEKVMTELLDMGLDDLTFSLDGATAKTNDAIRGKGVFDKAISTIKKLQDLKHQRKSQVPVTRISFVITNRNYQEAPQVVKLAASLGMEAIQFSTLLEWDSNRHLSMQSVAGSSGGTVLLASLRRAARGQANPHKSLEEAAELAEDLGIYSNVKSIIGHGFFSHATPKFCYAPWELLFINSRGTALACCILASFYENELGNVRDTRLRDLWYSDKMQAFRDRLGEGKFYKGCERCLPDFVDMFDEREARRQDYMVAAGKRRVEAVVKAGTGGGAWH